ncbi:hypothetical protein FRC14_003489 [Serendipita sp. 396]|nr:hypothetical protein FRC14_003489 [Serendipita sp. 396]KAG8821477.1 hypothetical protein FRC19_007738 [Serendipita sp. 401]
MNLGHDPEPIFSVRYFTLDYEHSRITIHATDTHNPTRPSEDIRETEKGFIKWYRQEPLESPTSRFWRRHIGNELAHKFLLLDPSDRREFTLTDFPPGYYLYTHHVGSGGTHDDIRHDGYIFGGGHKFRSTKEALYHFAWLMIGMPQGRCKCVYDTPSSDNHRHQGRLNKELKKKWSEFLNNRARRRFLDFQKREGHQLPYEPPLATINVFNEDCFLINDPLPSTTAQTSSMQPSITPQLAGPSRARAVHPHSSITSTQYPISSRFAAVSRTDSPHG